MYYLFGEICILNRAVIIVFHIYFGERSSVTVVTVPMTREHRNKQTVNKKPNSLCSSLAEAKCIEIGRPLAASINAAFHLYSEVGISEFPVGNCSWNAP